MPIDRVLNKHFHMHATQFSEQTLFPRPIMVALFLLFFVVFLYVANLVVFEALASTFLITARNDVFFLAVSLGFLSLGFIISTLLGMRYYNALTRWSYVFFSIWIGVFTYLFFASVLYGVLLLCDIANVREWGMLLFGGALVVSVYGVLHARKIVIRTVPVSIEHLPEAWKGRSIIWISDIHLGQRYGAQHAQAIVDAVNALPHDIIFIGGDLYDGTGAPDLTTLTAPLQRFSGHLGIYFVTGNHEEFGAEEAFLRAVRAANIRTLIDEKIEIDGLQIIGVDYHNCAKREDFRAVLTHLAIDHSRPSLLLKHEPKDVQVAADAGISLQLSGHTHRGQMWPLGYIADVIYKGYAYGLKRAGTTQVYTSSGVGTWGPPLRVGTDSEIVRITFL